MLNSTILTLELSIWSYEYPWVWHYQEFPDMITMEALSTTEVDALIDTFFSGTTYSNPKAADNQMKSAYEKYFGSLDTFDTESDEMWITTSTSGTDLAKGMVGR